VHATVKGKSLRDGLRPPLTVTARGGQSNSGRDEEMVASWSNKEMETIENQLDSYRPIQGLQTPADRERRGAARAGVGKPPGNEPAGTRRRVWRAVYGDLGEADDLA
jgi:hypothetical protein